MSSSDNFASSLIPPHKVEFSRFWSQNNEARRKFHACPPILAIHPATLPSSHKASPLFHSGECLASSFIWRRTKGICRRARTHTQQAFPACSVLTNQHESQTILRCVPPFARYRAARSLLCVDFFSINRRRTRIKSGPRVPKSVSERPYFVTDRPGSHQSLFPTAFAGAILSFFAAAKSAGLVDGRACVPSAPNWNSIFFHAT